MARTQLRGTSQILNDTVDFAKLESTSVVNSLLGIGSPTVSADNTVPTSLAVKMYVAQGFAAISSGLLYKGVFDAFAPNDYSAIAPASQGDFYKVSIPGTIAGVDYQVGDMIIVNKDCSGAPLPADVDKIDNTESPDLVKLAAVQELTNKTMDGDLNTFTDISITSLKPASADANLFIKRDGNGAVISGGIVPADITGFNEAAQDAVGNILTNTGNVKFAYDDALNTITASVAASAVCVVSQFVSESLTNSGDNTVYTCSQVPVLVVGITVDGLEQEENYDYTIDFATKTITFSSANNAADRVKIKYFKG
jgi:hypothetical protein